MKSQAIRKCHHQWCCILSRPLCRHNEKVFESVVVLLLTPITLTRISHLQLILILLWQKQKTLIHHHHFMPHRACSVHSHTSNCVERVCSVNMSIICNWAITSCVWFITHYVVAVVHFIRRTRSWLQIKNMIRIHHINLL